MARDQIQDGLTLDEWQQDSQLGNEFKGSPDQLRLIEIIRSEVTGDTKHIRVLGEPGLGKTRIVLEALKEERIAPSVLYFPHGSQFGRSLLFRQLLKSRHEKPLVLVIDELPDSEMAEVWAHLKPRCGFLKIVSLDHGKDESYDAEISRHEIPKLADDSIKKILADRIGECRELDRWVAICEGSPGSGGWSGPTSLYLRRRRDKFRKWLAEGYAPEVIQWIEAEIEGLDRMIEREEIDEERMHFE